MEKQPGKLAQFGAFARRVIALALPYFNSSDQKWKARGHLAVIVALNLAAVYMLVLLNEWNRAFYDSLQNKDAAVFWKELLRFTYLAFGFIIIAVYRSYLTQLLQMRWREWMTKHYLDRWLAHKIFYHLELTRFTGSVNAPPDNPDQRIAEDIDQFTASTISLTMGLLNSVVTLVSFVGILWALSGSFSFHFNGSEYTIPGFMVWMAVVYSLVGSVLTHYIGRPLIKLNFLQQQREADFRYNLVRVREYSESIALDKGEPVERDRLGRRFSSVLDNFLQLIRAQKRLTWFTVGFSQAAVVFPFIVAAPRYFSGAIQLGELMQISSAFGRVQDALSWFVDAYSSLASWRATTDRITSFEASFQRLSRSSELQVASSHTADATLGLDEVAIDLPGGAPLLQGRDMRLNAGTSVVLKGASGSGKSTLFRVLAGIWPWAKGRLTLPQGFHEKAMFLPQKPYFPNGSLREALAYPDTVDAYTDEQMGEALRNALLPHLVNDLGRQDAWGQKLSSGEQQRLAIARALLRRPQWLFVDEATSALDEEAEQRIYARLKAMMETNGGTLVSIAHRPAVAGFHERQWEVAPASVSGAHVGKLAEV